MIDKIKKMQEREREMLDKYGFYVHCVMPDKVGEMADVHTHGLLNNYDHPEVQMVLPIEPKMAHQIIVNVVDKIKAGEKYSPPVFVEGIIHNYPIKLAQIEKDKLIRIILPDSNGKFPGDVECEDTYARQATIVVFN